jgi:hypothetical protein
MFVCKAWRLLLLTEGLGAVFNTSALHRKVLGSILSSEVGYLEIFLVLFSFCKLLLSSRPRYFLYTWHLIHCSQFFHPVLVFNTFEKVFKIISLWDLRFSRRRLRKWLSFCKRYAPLKRRLTSTRLHDATTQKTAISKKYFAYIRCVV